MLSTQTLSSRDAICASELMPTWYLKSPTLRRCSWDGMGRSPSGGDGSCDAECGGDLVAPAGLHPRVGLLRVLDDLAHVRVEAEEAVRQAEGIAGVAQRSHAAHEVRPAPAQHHVETRRPLRAGVLAQPVGHRAHGR